MSEPSNVAGRSSVRPRTVPVNCWCEDDRKLWLAAIQPADPFEETSGTRANHRAISNRNIARGYGRWLTFLAQRDLFHPDMRSAELITAENITLYVADLVLFGNKTSTVLARLEELTEMAKVLNPTKDWAILRRMSAKVRAQATAPLPKRTRGVTTQQLVKVGLLEIKAAETDPRPVKAAVRYRDGLMIALLAHRPLRRRNFTHLSIGEDLVRNGSGWIIALPGSATKTHVPLEYTIPNLLVPFLETYILVHRPVLLACRGRWARTCGSRLWISSDGSPLEQDVIYQRITKVTHRVLGIPVNPHAFRDVAASTLAIYDPEHVGVSTPLLGHDSKSTTERYYIRANSRVAQRAYAAHISKMRRGSDQFPRSTPRLK